MFSMTISSAECSTWYAVFLTITVAVVEVNLLSILLFVKNSNLRTRAMYLVINLTVADMFVGGTATSVIVFRILLYGCEVGNEIYPIIGSTIVEQEWQRKLTVTLFIMTVVSLLLWLPYVVYTINPFSVIDRFSYLTFLRLKLSFSLLYHTISLVNPIIYTIRMPEFRRGLMGVARIFQRGGGGVTIRGSPTIYGLYRCSPSCISGLSRIIAA